MLLVATGIVLAGYAAVALVLTVVATTRERGRTLSALRTLGLDARTARAMTFGELAPLAVAAVLAGTADRHRGALAAHRRARARPAHRRSRGDARCRSRGSRSSGAAVVVLVALAVAVAVESAVRRRDRLGEVLRVGER